MDKNSKPSDHGRAWAEIDLDALAFNAAQLRALLPDGCKLMAVVKTDAYGHGLERIAMRLRREGLDCFAVATVGEGIRLRECGVDGEILVLGYTHPDDAGLLSAFDLTQLVADGAHAGALDKANYQINVQIAIDTGMHRLGIEPENFTEIESVYACRNLHVSGVATHLATSDSLEPEDIEFTNEQIDRFSAVTDKLKSKGYDVGVKHAQASYGLSNHCGLKYDFVRVGIMLYGVMSNDDQTLIKPALRPVLSLKAVVAQVRWIGAGQTVSYGRSFTTGKAMRLATVCIGYADGIPRQMSGKGGMCIIRGRRVPIVGRICMDFLMVDVTDVDSVQAGDIATLIGEDGAEVIRCEELAAASGTVTNDILCRLGSRVGRLYK